MHGETKDIKPEELVPFKSSQEQAYEDGWMQQLMDCINRAGLKSPVIARPVDGGKYEVICGNNRVKALEMLGCEVIHTEIRNGLSDDEAAALYDESRITQQPFSACSYSQKFEIVKQCEKSIKENSCQGKRTDLDNKTAAKPAENPWSTCVYHVSSENNLDNTYVQPVSNRDVEAGVTSVQPASSNLGKSRRSTIRDEIAHRLGISAATLSKYRRIIKLPDDLLQSIACLLDEKRITFEAAYAISNMMDTDIKHLIDGIYKYPDRKLDLDKLKEFPKRNTEKSDDIIPIISRNKIMEALPPKGS